MDRRTFVRNAAATALVAAAIPGTAAVTKIVGIGDRPYQSQRFNEAGYYAFQHPEGGYYRAYYCYRDGEFIALSEGPGLKAHYHFSDQFFDRTVWGRCMTVEEAERAAGRVS